MRTVIRRAGAGDPDAQLALDVYCHRIRKYIGAYYAVLGRLDAIAFTAGIGENSAEVRARALAGLLPLGIAVDPARNDTGAAERVISPDDTPVTVCVVPTDEERAIAEEIATLLTPSVTTRPHADAGVPGIARANARGEPGPKAGPIGSNGSGTPPWASGG
jgi:acetate kinase